MRVEATREKITAFMKELARRAPRTGSYKVYFVGGGTAVYMGWRPSSVDIDVYSDEDAVFRDCGDRRPQAARGIGRSRAGCDRPAYASWQSRRACRATR